MCVLGILPLLFKYPLYVVTLGSHHHIAAAAGRWRCGLPDTHSWGAVRAGPLVQDMNPSHHGTVFLVRAFTKCFKLILIVLPTLHPLPLLPPLPTHTQKKVIICFNVQFVYRMRINGVEVSSWHCVPRLFLQFSGSSQGPRCPVPQLQCLCWAAFV